MEKEKEWDGNEKERYIVVVAGDIHKGIQGWRLGGYEFPEDAIEARNEHVPQEPHFIWDCKKRRSINGT